MQRAFKDDPQKPGRRIWRRGRAAAIGSECAAILMAVLTAAYLIAGIYGLFRGAPAWFVLLQCCLSVFGVALTRYVWRDMRGKKGGADVTGLGLRLRKHGRGCSYIDLSAPDAARIRSG